MTVKGIIFDADHTLYVPKAEKAYEEKFRYLANELGISRKRLREIWEQQVDRALDIDEPGARQREKVLERTLMELELPKEERSDLIEEALDRFWSQVVDDLDYDEDTPAMLRRLEDEGIRLVAVASDEFKQPLERKLDQVLGDWEDYFDLMITPEDAGSMKPSEEFYHSVLMHTELDPEEVVMVGDSWTRDLKPAQELGIRTVLLSSEEEGDPDFRISKLSELEQVVRGLR